MLRRLLDEERVQNRFLISKMLGEVEEELPVTPDEVEKEVEKVKLERKNWRVVAANKVIEIQKKRKEYDAKRSAAE